MKKFLRPSLGLIGQVFAILLLAILIEVGASVFFYERASQLSLRDDEARRLAEHLIIARKLMDAEPIGHRPMLAHDLTTTRYTISWSKKLPPRLRNESPLDRVRHQIVEWEPSLASTHMRLRLAGSARNAVIFGSLELKDGSSMNFATREPLREKGLTLERILLALGPAVAIILIGGVLLRQTLLPMRRLAHAVERVRGDGDYEEVPEGGPGEVRRVIRGFNRMQERIHRLVADRTQALAAVGHDMRTPLARLRLRADSVSDAGVYEAMEGDIAEMEAMIGSLLDYLGGDASGEKPVAVDLGVMCATIADEARDRGRIVTYWGPDHVEMHVRRVGIKRALQNLVENALHYADQAWISIEETKKELILRVEDDGPGIPEEAIHSALQPFVRLDRARARDTMGLGLGLSIVVRAVDEEGGVFHLSNRDEGGLRAEIRLPIRRG